MFVLCHISPSVEFLIEEIPFKIEECVTCPHDNHIESIIERVHGTSAPRLCATLSDMTTNLYYSIVYKHSVTRLLIFEGTAKDTDYIMYSCILKIYKNSTDRYPSS